MTSDRSRRPHDRPFSLFDQLVLLAPLAVGIEITRSMLGEELTSYQSLLHLGWFDTVLDWIPVVFFGMLPRYAAVLMPALLIIRLRRPRPPLRKLFRQPGAAASAAGTAALAIGGMILLAGWLCNSGHYVPGGTHAWRLILLRVPVAVLAAWGLLAISGRWRPEPTWIDRAGRLVGGFWITLWMLRWYSILHGF